jgi:hypothetical protein
MKKALSEDKVKAKERMKAIDYKVGAIKRKLKIKAGESIEPGSLIKKAKERGLTKRQVAIRGLV